MGEYLHNGDVLVLNRTRVIAARLFARRPTGGRVELLLLRRQDKVTWEVMIGGKQISAGKQFSVEAGPAVEVMAQLGGPVWLVRFAEPIEPFLEAAGHVPLPPYIHERLSDPERYQTIYGSLSGSAAAPTAGLHFTAQLLDQLADQGVRRTFVTLHVGLDTFAPVTVDEPTRHKIHTEWCEVPLEAAGMINAAREGRARVVAVGTTSVRALESAARYSYLGRFPKIAPYSGNTDLFILPGFKFAAVDALITNFHLPRSTLLMLVSAFAGTELVLHTYEIAKQEGYRFYSFGDAMLIL